MNTIYLYGYRIFTYCKNKNENITNLLCAYYIGKVPHICLMCLITYLRILFFCSFTIANSRKSYKTLQMNRLIFPAIVRDHDYILYSAVYVNLTIHLHIRTAFSAVVYHTYTLYPLIVWAMGLSDIVHYSMCTLQTHNYIKNTRGYL